MSDQVENSTRSTTRPLKFIHKESPSFRTYHADGAWGMLNNQGNIQLNFFVEHEPFPADIIYPVDAEGNYSDKAESSAGDEKKYFIVERDFQAGIVLSANSAKQIHALLGNFIQMQESAKLG